MVNLRSRWLTRILISPEANIFLFAFLLHFVYEVWQSPFFEFYQSPSLLDKVKAITHCTFGDAVISLVCFWLVSLLFRNRIWLRTWQWKQVSLFTGLGWIYTFGSEIYRVRIANLYGIRVLVVPVLGISWLPLIQWILLPPLVLYFVHRQIREYEFE